jgi:UDP-2,4-diacetamido-2,4,6-trideoxy-beta-L-altropyranose hydrolase
MPSALICQALTSKAVTTMTIRADCDHETGYGHVMRCLAIAEALQTSAGYETIFVMNASSDAEPVRRAGYGFRLLPSDKASFAPPCHWADAKNGPVFIDSYNVTIADLENFEKDGFCIAMFEDGKRLDNYPCDVVIDPSPDSVDLGYRGAKRTRFCLGPDYFPLRDEFLNSQQGEEVSKSVEQIVVTFGGSDPDDQTVRLVKILSDMNLDTNIKVVFGPGYTGRAEGVGCIELVRDAKTVAPVFSSVDIVISGGGGTALELAYLGRPMILIGLADNQVANASAIATAGAARYLGMWMNISDSDIATAITALIGNPEQRQMMSTKGRQLVDGRAAGRIAEIIDLAWTQSRAASGANLGV